MDTLEDSKQSSRRRHGPALKAKVLAECAQPHASVASIAMAHGLSANIVHKWRRLAGKSPAPAQSTTLEFVAVPLAAQAQAPAAAAGDIAIELRRGGITVKVSWPMIGAESCAAWVHECCGEPRMIRVDAVWLAVEPLDMRAGTDTALAQSNEPR